MSSNETKYSKTSLNEEEEEESELKEIVKLKDAGSSSNSTIEESDKKSCARPYVRSKLPRLRWTNDLHLRFVQVVERLGGQDKATPKMVLQLMNVKGLHIAHVKSHLQMYRSKKFDDICQGDQRSEGGDHNIYNLSQLPMLQCYNRTYDSSFRYEDATIYRHSWMRNPLREHCSSEKINDHFRLRSAYEKMEMLQGQYSKLPNNTLKINPANIHQEPPRITIDLECSGYVEKNKGVKRKVSNLNLDLNLSLGVSEGPNGEGEAEQGDLSLSLYSSSLSRIRNKMVKEDDEKAKMASTLDLTI